MVLRRLQINKCDVIPGGRSLRPGTMASVGPEVSVWAVSTPSLFYFHTVFRALENVLRAGSNKQPLVNGRIVGVGVWFSRKLPAASTRLSLLLCWTGGQLNVQEDAAPRNMNDASGRVVGSAPEFGHTWSWLTSLSCFCPFLAVQNKLRTHCACGFSRYHSRFEPYCLWPAYCCLVFPPTDV